MEDDFETKCPLCFCDLDEQPDGITEGPPNLFITGCCKKKLHGLCWQKSPKVKTWTEDNAFDKIRNKLQPDQFYKANKCPFCRKLSDIVKIEPKNNNVTFSSDSVDLPPLMIELTATPSIGPISALSSVSQLENAMTNQLLNAVLGFNQMNQAARESSVSNTVPTNSQSLNRARYRIHPYSNRERY